jgi:replicative DNA helicase
VSSSNTLYNEEAENFLLAAFLRYPEEYVNIVGDTGLTGRDFVGTETSRIAKAIDEVVSERREPALPHIVSALKLAGHEDTSEYLSRLTSLPCSVQQGIGYARTVREFSLRRQLGNAGAKVIQISRDEGDIETALTQAENELRKVTMMVPAQDRSPDPADILARMHAVGAREGIPILFAPSLQMATGGIRPTEMWVIGGATSTGKSALAANLVLDILSARNKTLALFNIEMSQETYMERLLAIRSGVAQRKIRDRVTVGHEDSEALSKAERFIGRSNFKLYDSIGTMAGIKNESRKLKNRQGLDIIIVDYIQSIRGTKGEEVADAREIAIELQALAKELGIAVVAFSQVSNQFAQDDIAQGGKGDYYSFKGHGAIRDNADIAILIRRNRRSQSPLLDMQLAKNRHGELVELTCDIELSTGRITERENEYE